MYAPLGVWIRATPSIGPLDRCGAAPSLFDVRCGVRCKKDGRFKCKLEVWWRMNDFLGRMRDDVFHEDMVKLEGWCSHVLLFYVGNKRGGGKVHSCWCAVHVGPILAILFTSMNSWRLKSDPSGQVPFVLRTRGPRGRTSDVRTSDVRFGSPSRATSLDFSGLGARGDAFLEILFTFPCIW